MNNKAYVLILFGMDDYFNTIQAIGGVYLNRQEAEHIVCSGDILVYVIKLLVLEKGTLL